MVEFIIIFAESGPVIAESLAMLSPAIVESEGWACG
jgi:hypothetical protein